MKKKESGFTSNILMAALIGAFSAASTNVYNVVEDMFMQSSMQITIQDSTTATNQASDSLTEVFVASRGLEARTAYDADYNDLTSGILSSQYLRLKNSHQDYCQMESAIKNGNRSITYSDTGWSLSVPCEG